MSHEIESIAYANAVPWHGLGTPVDPDLTPDEFLVAAGLDWTVEMRDLYADTGGDDMVPVPSRKALVRSSDNAVLTIASPGWYPLQNRDVLGFMSSYVAAGAATLETAGSLRGGRVVWGLARLGHHFEVRPGDRTEGYLLFTSPHEVGRAISIRTTTVRVVCANTLAIAERDESEIHYKQNHLSAFDADAAKDRIGEAHEQLARAEATAKTLDRLKLGIDDAVRKAILPVFNPEAAEAYKAGDRSTLPPSIRKILDSVETGPGAIPGTGYGVLNGVTHYLDHVSGVDADQRLASAWLGKGARRKADLEARLLELAS